LSLVDITFQSHETEKRVPVNYLKGDLVAGLGVFTATLRAGAGYEDVVDVTNNSAIIIIRTNNEGGQIFLVTKETNVYL